MVTSTRSSTTPLSHPELRPPIIDRVGVEERVQRLSKRSIKEDSKLHALKLVLSVIDLTTLEGADSSGRVRQLCAKARQLHRDRNDLPTVAAVCVYPNFIAEARGHLEDSAVRVAAVATAFPSGQLPLELKLEDARYAVDQGAEEIDMVLSRGRFLSGDYACVFDEVAQVKEACGAACLKVILETGELGSLEAVRRAADLAMHAGADFIKTSTGKIQPAATPTAALVMMEAIRDFFYETGRQVGVKVAGGVSTAKSAIQYLVLLRETLGEAWLSPEWFRIGASGLANDVLMQIVKQETGVYQSSDYYSND